MANEERKKMRAERRERRRKRRPVISGVIFLMIGLYLLAIQKNMIDGLNIETHWPVFIIIVGIVLILGALTRSRKLPESS